MPDFRSLNSFETRSRFPAGLFAEMFVARGLDFLPTWLVTARLKLDAHPLARRLPWVRMALFIAVISFRHQMSGLHLRPWRREESRRGLVCIGADVRGRPMTWGR